MDSDSTGLYRNFGKRILDLALVLASALIAVPVILSLALLVSLDGSRPFFRQERIGRGGRTFRILKLRTMVPDAESRLGQHLSDNPAAAVEWDRTQKLRNDPRVTTVGRMLRKTSMDELPQLWNVLTGEMSLVGPRPMLVTQRDLYPGTAYFRLRPGITGPWQISQRNEAEFASRARYDSQYAKSLSLPTDVGILLRTVIVVLKGTGC